MTVRVSIVGRVAVERDGGRVEGGPLAAGRIRLLLVALATAEGPLPAAALADRLWTDPPATWPDALRGAVGALRGALAPLGLDGQRLVVTEGAGWRLAEGTEVDLVLAKDELRRAETALDDGDAGSAATSAERALGLLSGEILPLDDRPWIDDLRRERSAGSSRALAAAADAALALGRLGRAAEAAAELLEADPLDEAAHRRVIRVRLAAGDRAGAIRAFDRCRAALTEALGVDPGPETTALYLQVLQSGSRTTGALPPRLRNRFVGRSRELAELGAALRTHRWVTLVGQGGIGKSRLALEAAHDPGLDAEGGRFWVALGDVPDAALVLPRIAAAVGVEASADPVAGIRAELAPVGRTLVVLDGCEDHRDILAEIVPRLLEELPELVVLCSSRTRLDAADRRIPVGPLVEGVALLGTRREESAAVVGADPEGAGAAALCARLGGVPLAIELAAAQLTSMSVDDLLEQLEGAGSTPGDVLAALVAQGYAALDDAESRMLRCLSVVDGTVPLGLARAMGEGSLPGPRIARILGGLGEAGFLAIDRSGVRWRYGVDQHLWPIVRDLTPAEERAEDLAALATAVEAIAPQDATAPPAPFRDAVLAAADGFRAVLAAGAEGELDRDRALSLAFRLHRSWALTGLAEGRYWLGRLLDGAGSGRDASLARFAAGYLAYWAGDSRAGAPLLRRAGAELETEAPAFAARALLYAAGLSDDEDEPDRAREEITRAVELARVAGGGLVASVELGFASVLAERGDPETVVAVERAMALLPESAPEGQRLAIAATGALAAWRSGEVEAARRLSRDAAPLLADGPSISRAVLGMTLAGLALADGDPDAAAASAGAALDDLRASGADREIPLAAALASRAAVDRGDSDGALLAARTAIGAAAEIDLAAPVALALEAVVRALPQHPDAASLAAAVAAIRRRGARPAPPGLAVPSGPGSDADDWRDALRRGAEAVA